MLTPKQRQFLKAEAHHLKPVVHIGKAGVTDALAAELDQMLDSLELMKIKLNQNTSEDEEAAVEALKSPGYRSGARLDHWSHDPGFPS